MSSHRPSAVNSRWLLLDSANLGEVMLSPQAMAQLEPGSVPAPDTVGARTLALSGVPFDAEFRIRDLIYDGALNQRFFQRHRVWIDFENERLVVVPSPGTGAGL